VDSVYRYGVSMNSSPGTAPRHSVLDMSPEEFRRIGHDLIDALGDFLNGLPQRRVTPGETPAQVRSALGAAPLPDRGSDAAESLAHAFQLLDAHSLFNGHPRFWGYVTSSAAPLGALADLLASAMNPNAGAWILSPMATEIEAQSIRWIAEFLGYPTGCGGLLVSGGNMANFVPFLAARRSKAPWDLRKEGMASPNARKLTVYASTEVHTWIHKAADLFGLGRDAIRWIPVDDQYRMRTDELSRAIRDDRAAGLHPFLAVGSAGTVSTGAVDPLREIAAIAREHDLWFHIDGAYGAPAAALPDAGEDLHSLHLADSIAVDPHKWLYAPLEAGCVLVRNPEQLLDAFEYSPAYYRFELDESERPLNYYSYGPQNSRGARAVKIWLILQVAGREGMVRMIGDDIRLAEEAWRAIDAHPRLEALTRGLSIVTFRYRPPDVDVRDPAGAEYVNRVNQIVADRIQAGGEAFVSNAVLKGVFALRLCIVNFRTTLADVRGLPELVDRLGAEVHAELGH
jgi:aromatic-L-amino-acid decarboxylase